MIAVSYGRASTCSCPKVKYESEFRALEGAERAAIRFDTPFRAYLCPGTTIWHIASRGFHPSVLRSRGRIMAYYIAQLGNVDSNWLRREVDGDRKKAARRAFDHIVVVLDRNKIITRKPGRLIALDRSALWRICAIGFEAWEKRQDTEA